MKELTKGAWPASKRIGLQRQRAVKVRTYLDDVGSSTMNGILAQQQWRGTLVAWYIVVGAISIIAGCVVLGWPFDSIVVLDIVSGVWLVLIGLLQIVQAFRIRKDAKKARRTLDPVAEPMAA
jgi:hypothetical protein